MRRPLTPGARGLGWMVLAQLCFAGMNVCTRLGSAHLPWAEIAAARFLIGAMIALGLAAVRGVSLRVTDRPGTWRRSVFGTISAVGTFYALSSTRIGLGDAATLSATAPIFVALLSGPLLGERVGRHLWLAVALAFLGIVALLRPSFEVAAPVAMVATVGAFFYALAMIWLRKIGPGESHEAVVLHFSLVGCAAMVLLALPRWTWPDLEGGVYLLGAGLGGGGAQLAMTRAYSLQRAAPVTALSNLGIVFTYLLALLVFPARPSGWQLAGSLLVIAATILVGRGARAARQAR
ncbi:MAG TPA: DMT family transporter [Gemmatimonadales bacterium]|nr:DMT family transporter [Gemmatimonadales bacterium]